MCAKLLQSCPTLWDPTDCSLPGSSVHGILQARVLECVAMPSSRGSSWPRDQTCVSYEYFTTSTRVRIFGGDNSHFCFPMAFTALSPKTSMNCRPGNSHQHLELKGHADMNEFWWILVVWAWRLLACVVRTLQQADQVRIAWWLSLHSSHLWLYLSSWVLCVVVVTLGWQVCVFAISLLIQ